MKITGIIIFISFQSLGLLNAQNKGVSDTTKYDLENKDQWEYQDSTLWEFSSEKPANGTQSLKYSIQENDIFELGSISTFDTEHNIQNVRTAKYDEEVHIIAGSYEGTILGITYGGLILWKNPLSGFVNHDIWCEDIDKDGKDEIFTANADAHIYCLSAEGKTRWSFKANDATMLSVTVIHHNNTPYVVCGGFDLSIYYLDAAGKLVKEVPSKGYSLAKSWGGDEVHATAPTGVHVANFLRKVVLKDGKEILAMHGTNNKAQGQGEIYLFNPLESKPYHSHKLSKEEITGMSGEFRPCFINDSLSILMGTSGHYSGAGITVYKPDTDLGKGLAVISKNISGLTGFGYRMLQPQLVNLNGEDVVFTLYGQRILLIPTNLDASSTEVLANKYTYNDLWYDKTNHKMIFASSQSGGSCVHFIDLNDPNWKTDYTNIEPIGRIEKILSETKKIRSNVQIFEKPSYQRDQSPVYLMTEKTAGVEPIINDIQTNYNSPIFYNSVSIDKENWDRADILNEKYRDRRDGRMKYILTQQEVLDLMSPNYIDAEGVVYWGGHGNDPYFYSVDTKKKLFDLGGIDKTTIQIYPEMGDYTQNFDYVINNLFIQLAEHIRSNNLKGNFYIRSKSPFWQSGFYLPKWDPVRSGKYADIFIPALEETGTQMSDISVAGRMGIWASGAANAWGARSARDNASYFGLRKRCDQNLPNNFLRHMIYNISCGATYINNFAVDQEYMSLLWELIAKGVLFVPTSEELLNISPIHLSMADPDSAFLDESANLKFITFYNEQNESTNIKVFNRMNGSWYGAPVPEYDFSSYAGTVKDRRLHFLPSYENGIVLITPPQEGINAEKNLPRGKLTDHLHPIYKDIMKEYYTDGRNYYSADGTQTYKADEYYQTIKEDIETNKTKLPLTVESNGTVAWVVAQTSPTHLRLTLIDGGYINPQKREARVIFHSVEPVKMEDMLDGTQFDISNPSEIKIQIPCGTFRFIDIELKNIL